MSNRGAEKLEAALPMARKRLRQISEVASTETYRPGGWTRKELLGHLIDSAANNHVRFAAASLSFEYRGAGYDQEGWVERHGYRDMTWPELVDLWYALNRLIGQLATRVPKDKLGVSCFIGNSPPVTLEFLMEDYVLHMQHHLDQIYGDGAVTPYPPA